MMSAATSLDDSELSNNVKDSRFELICGVLIAMYAAMLAITDLGAGKFGDDQIIASNEKASAYQWYQSKSIKESLVEGQQALIETLTAAGAVQVDKRIALADFSKRLADDIARYKMEKREILQGSKEVGEANWAQDVDGKKGMVTGAEEWAVRADGLDAAGDIFDRATLFLQLCLVVGAITLILQNPRSRRAFFVLANVMGVIGIIISIMAFRAALSVP